MSKAFVRLVRLAVSPEDAFTECLAALLAEDTLFARDFVERLCGPILSGADVRSARISIETQVSYPGSCVDMVRSVNGRRAIGVEHKLWSEEGVDQLLRYCGLGFDHLAFITAAPQRVTATVLANPAYKRPADGREHFSWRDFYPAVEAAATRGDAGAFARALRELFIHLGFEPPKPEVGDLLDPDSEIRRRNRQNFAKLWDVTRERLRERGWKSIGTGTIAELYVREGKAKHVEWAWVDPTWARKLRVRLTPRANVAAETVAKALREGLMRFDDIEISVIDFSNRQDRRKVAEAAISTRALLEDAHTPVEMSEALARFVLGVFDAAG
jgi:hypothetical protein